MPLWQSWTATCGSLDCMTPRNEPCPCGSGRRYKDCCGDLAKREGMLVILDDYFPNLLTGFRIAEYNAYLDAFPDLLIMSVSNEFDRAASEYFARFPRFKDRVKRFEQAPLLRAKLAYVTFLENAYIFVPYLE